MNVKEGIKDLIIKKAIQKVISDSNKKLDFDAIIITHGTSNDVHKKLVIKIVDMESNTGLGIKEGKMVEVDKVENPDTIFSMTKNTFSAILLNKIDHRQAYLIGAIEAYGESWVRDSILLSKIFDEIKVAMKNGS
jgi:putative sterol carrier protein